MYNRYALVSNIFILFREGVFLWKKFFKSLIALGLVSLLCVMITIFVDNETTQSTIQNKENKETVINIVDINESDTVTTYKYIYSSGRIEYITVNKATETVTIKDGSGKIEEVKNFSDLISIENTEDASVTTESSIK